MIQLFLVIALGYFLFKIKILDLDLNKKLTTLLLSVTTPEMIVSSVLSTTVTQGLNNILFVFAVGFAIYLIMPVLGFFIVTVLKNSLPQQCLYIFMTVFSNIGFMGFPVMKAIFGNEAVFFTAIFNMIFNLFVFTTGIMIMNYGTGQKVKLDLKNLQSPGVNASLVALLIYFTGIQLPNVLSSTITMIGDITTPMAM